jgi:hypothetical protein
MEGRRVRTVRLHETEPAGERPRTT